MTRIYLVRHGITEGADGLAVGQVDLPLAAAGAAALGELAATWEAPPPDRLVASDLERALASARVLNERWGLAIETEPRLREMDFGAWDGVSWQEICGRDEARLRTWTKVWWHTGPPGGESLDQLAVRARRWLDEVLRTSIDATVVVVAHGGSIRTLLASVLGLPLERVFHLRLDHGRVSVIETTHRGLEVGFVNAETFNMSRAESPGYPTTR